MALHDDQAGVGDNLAFPTMSSCAAIVVRLANTLVGIHKTQTWHNNTAKLFQVANAMIGASAITDVYILAWNAGVAEAHDVTQIRQTLNANAVPCYVFDYSNKAKDKFKAPHNWSSAMSDLCTFATFNAGARPTFAVKRTTKVVSERDEAAFKLHFKTTDARYKGFNETLDVKNLNPISFSDFSLV